MGRGFYLYPLKNGVLMSEILDPETGARVCYRNTGSKNRDEALILVSGWLRDGIPARKKGRKRIYSKPAKQTVESATGLSEILKSIELTKNLTEDGALRIAEALRARGLLDFSTVKASEGKISFVSFLEKFWNYDESPYVREKLSHGQSIGRQHCKNFTNCVNGFYKVFFENRTLRSITRRDLKDFAVFISQKRERPDNRKGQFSEVLSASYRNLIFLTGKIALRWAFREKLIYEDITAGLMGFSGAAKKRGVLTPQEARAVFAAEWKDKLTLAANLLACTTGCRLGEALAIRKSRIGEKTLDISCSWDRQGDLKSTKTGEPRRVPLLPVVRGLLLELLEENPHKDVVDPFLFYGLLPDKPIDGKVILNALHEACGAVGIDSRARNICYHSWRHYYAARMADTAEAEKVMRITGHKTKAVFEVYEDHITEENLDEMGKAGEQVFGKILEFRKMT